MNDKIEFNFTYYAMKLLGKNLYSSPWTAVSEIVANGIDAGAKEVYVYIDMQIKEHATVEIFDNGSGMTYEDLCSKYTLIGRNRRDQETENDSGKTLGRKGIGKLAALYLSPHYIISTKTDSEQTTWEIDTRKFKDSDIPTLDRVESVVSFSAQKYWDKCNTGTMIHLSDVDLRRIGTERVKKLSSILASYYLPSEINSSIYVCVKDDPFQDISFTKIEKTIYYETMYSLFDNRDEKNRLQEKVFLTQDSDYDIVDVPRDTLRLPTDRFECSGKIKMADTKGITKELPYDLRGWLGIHVSLQKEILLRNVESKKGYTQRPNTIRLYVRGKLAVENLMSYIGSNQAFANYIEGEISFDALDADDFEDSSTSSREGYTLSDPRVQQLLQIVEKICSALIQNRSKIGTQINSERENYLQSLREQEEMLRKEEEKKRHDAEREKEIAQRQYEIATVDLGSEKRRSTFLKNSLSEDQLSFSKRLHMVKINNSTIKNIITGLVERKRRGLLTVENAWDGIKSISYCNERIKAVLEYYAAAEFDPKDEHLEGDLFEFIAEYCKEITQKSLDEDERALSISVESSGEYVTSFIPQDIGVLLDNVISNSIKSQSTNVSIKMYSTDTDYCIDIKDNGKGLEKADPTSIFEFGKSYTRHGTGVGLYHVREIIEGMNGSVFVNTENKDGFELDMRFEK